MKRILVVEGNLQEENQGFKDGGFKTVEVGNNLVLWL